MALQQTTLGQRIAYHRDFLMVLLIISVACLAMIVLSFAYGVHQAGPWLVIPDPANGVGMPF